MLILDAWRAVFAESFESGCSCSRRWLPSGLPVGAAAESVVAERHKPDALVAGAKASCFARDDSGKQSVRDFPLTVATQDIDDAVKVMAPSTGGCEGRGFKSARCCVINQDEELYLRDIG